MDPSIYDKVKPVPHVTIKL
jgi:hypothetical protein